LKVFPIKNDQNIFFQIKNKQIDIKEKQQFTLTKAEKNYSFNILTTVRL